MGRGFLRGRFTLDWEIHSTIEQRRTRGKVVNDCAMIPARHRDVVTAFLPAIDLLSLATLKTECCVKGMVGGSVSRQEHTPLTRRVPLSARVQKQSKEDAPGARHVVLSWLWFFALPCRLPAWCTTRQTTRCSVRRRRHLCGEKKEG